MNPKCLRMCDKCKDFYKSVFNSERNSCFIPCPKGYSIYITSINSKKIIFPCLKIKGLYKKKTNPTHSTNYNPILSKEVVSKIIESCLYTIELENRLYDKSEFTATTFHEIKKYNSQIKNHCESIFSRLNLQAQTIDKFTIKDLNDIWICAGMISSRFTLGDLDSLNATNIRETPYDVNIYGKFDKIQKIFKCNSKNLSITMRGNSFRYFKAYQSFEIIPFLLLENAIKYSHPNGEIIINFNEPQNEKDQLLVSITSDGPYCDEEDIKHIFEKGFRGKYAKSIIPEGNGIGLFFAKSLAEIHNIDISAHSIEPTKKYEDTIYARFMIQLCFKSTFSKK